MIYPLFAGWVQQYVYRIPNALACNIVDLVYTIAFYQ